MPHHQLITIDEDALIDLARALVRLRTVNDASAGSSELPAATLVASTMRGFGWEPSVVEVAPGRPNVVAVVDGGGGPGPTIMFEGHTDVVTEGNRSEWSFDPFGAEIRDGHLLGRGSADMKAGVAAMITPLARSSLPGRSRAGSSSLLWSTRKGSCSAQRRSPVPRWPASWTA